jgi:uncharacterized protein YuzE
MEQLGNTLATQFSPKVSPTKDIAVMKIIYDQEKDILQIALVDTNIEETAQIAPGLILDYDGDGNVIGLELRKASQKVDNPYAICYLVGEANTDKPQPTTQN